MEPTGKQVVKMNLTVIGENEDYETFMNSFLSLATTANWQTTDNSVFTKSADYNAPSDVLVDEFNDMIELAHLPDLTIFADVRKYYQWGN